MRAQILLSLAAATMIGGCTPTSINSAGPAAGISRGYAYQLPRLAYDIEVTRQLDRCPESAGGEIRLTAAVTAGSHLAPGETIVIDYLAVADTLKTADLALESHPNGMLKSVNLTVNDKTADLVQELVKSVVSVGKIAIGVPTPSVVSAGEKDYDGPLPYLRCAESFKKKLDSLPGLKAAIKPLEAAAKKAAKDLSDLQEAAKTGKPPKADKLAQLARASRLASEAVDEAKKAVADTIAELTLTDKFSTALPTQGERYLLPLAAAIDGKTKPSAMFELYLPSTGGRSFLVPLDAQLQPDIAAAKPQGYPGGEAGRQAVDRDRVRQQLAVDNAARNGQPGPYQAQLVGLGRADIGLAAGPLSEAAPLGDLPVASTCDVNAKDCGFVYRSPAPGRLRLCGAAAASDSADPNVCWARVPGDASILFQEDRLIPQYGKLASLPLKNGAFSNNALTAEFGDDGHIIKMGYRKLAAEGVAMAASVNEGLGGLTELISFERGKELRELKARKEVLDAQYAEQQALGKLTPTELEKLAKEKSIVDAQIALAQSQASAQALQQPSQVTQVSNETLLLDAEIARAKKLIELKKLQAELQALNAPPPPADED